MTKPSIVLVDDHEILRAGAAKYLGEQFEVVGSRRVRGLMWYVECEQRALNAGSCASPSLLIDETSSRCSRLVWTDISSSRRWAIVCPSWYPGHLMARCPSSPQIAGFLLDIDDVVAKAPGIDQLSRREREVAEYIARGYSYRRTAEAMFVSVKTVETHMSHIFEKLGVASRHELAVRAFESGLVSPEGA